MHNVSRTKNISSCHFRLFWISLPDYISKWGLFKILLVIFAPLTRHLLATMLRFFWPETLVNIVHPLKLRNFLIHHLSNSKTFSLSKNLHLINCLLLFCIFRSHWLLRTDLYKLLFVPLFFEKAFKQTIRSTFFFSKNLFKSSNLSI